MVMQQQNSIKYTSAAFLWLIIVLGLLLSPTGPSMPKTYEIPGLDKLAHFILFAVLTFLTAKAIQERKMTLSIWKIIAIVSLIGLSTEIVQIFIDNRQWDFFDLIADIVGAMSVLLIFKNSFQVSN